MDITARFDTEARDERGKVCRVQLIVIPKDGTATTLHAVIEPKERALATKLATAEPEPNNLRRLREVRGLSQVSLARLAGVSQSQLSHWESGSYKPLMKNAIALAVALKVKMDDLGIDFYGMEPLLPALRSRVADMG